jgi:hypothetical protein
MKGTIQWQNQKTQFQTSIKFYVIEFYTVSTKEFTIPKIIIFHKLLVDH